MRLAVLGLCLTALAACAGPGGTGAALSPRAPAPVRAVVADTARLSRGEVLSERLEFDARGGSYVGGVSRAVVLAPPARVAALLGDVTALPAVLPRTRRAELVGSRGSARLVEVEQGNSLVQATYTIELVPGRAPGDFSFHLDPTRPHDVDDVYGHVRVEPFDEGRSLVTLSAAVDVGSPLLHALFGRKIQDLILSAPHRLREHLAAAPPLAAGAVAFSDAPRP